MILRTASWIVPRPARAGWRKEWEAELAYAWKVSQTGEPSDWEAFAPPMLRSLPGRSLVIDAIGRTSVTRAGTVANAGVFFVRAGECALVVRSCQRQSSKNALDSVESALR